MNISKSNFFHHLAELTETQLPVQVLVRKQDHLRHLRVTDPLPQTREHVLQLLETDHPPALLREELEHPQALILRKLDALVLPFQELDELVLLQLPAPVGVYLVHQVLGLLLVDLHLARLKHLDYLVLGHAARVVGVELHENAQILLLGATFGPALAHIFHGMQHFLNYITKTPKTYRQTTIVSLYVGVHSHHRT